MHAAQKTTLWKAALALASLLVLLECGLVAALPPLRGAVIKTPLVPSNLGDADVFVMVSAGLIAFCQVIAVWRRYSTLSVTVAILFLTIGLLGLVCVLLASLTYVSGQLRGDGTFLGIIVAYWLVGTWLFVGVVMAKHAIDSVVESLEQNH